MWASGLLYKEATHAPPALYGSHPCSACLIRKPPMLHLQRRLRLCELRDALLDYLGG